ncbi:hypothetical protein PVAND_011660 [Polypedilum vanderplanki]|uniref:Nanos-type domain-containing protein n=1 Tax=Polypedilum vanderplanki TaxID=319348 RepID=A0A9J6CJY4_POLVA|nr:hypothetical protein PVAND_011660 [Polypedilum vanderplanki]
MSCISFMKQLLKFGRKLSKMASNLKIESYKYTKIEKVNLDFTLGNNKSENSSGYFPSMNNESISDQSVFIIDNLKKIGLEELEKDNIEKMICNYSSINVDDNWVNKPPRSPWQDLNFNENDYFGFEEKVYFNLNQQMFSEENSTQVSAECSSYSYSPMSSYGSNNFFDSETSTDQQFMFENNKIIPSESELASFDLNEHFSKTQMMTLFSPSIASTPFVQQPKKDIMLSSEFNIGDINNQWNSFLVDQPKSKNSIAYNEQQVKTSKKRRSKVKPNKKSLENFCAFCKNNGEPMAVFNSHAVKDAKGRVLCPKLRIYKCPICGKDGDEAHTTKYCPEKKIITYEDIIKIEALKAKYKR